MTDLQKIKLNKLLKKLKGLLKSKVFYFNSISGVLILAQQLSGANILSAKDLVVILAVGNFLLRFFTKLPLDQK